MSDTKAALVWCPFPDAASARAAAATLIDEKLIACANILPGITSVFEWQGEVQAAEEVAVLFKTTAQCLDSLVARLGQCHPYDTPAIIGWECDAAHPETLQWLAGQCQDAANATVRQVP